MNLYDEKKPSYFEDARLEILPLLPQKFNKVFEVGCGTGATLNHLKAAEICSWAGGIELCANPIGDAIDLFIEGNIEENLELPLEAESIDVILCLDVLEHLVNPWLTVQRLSRYLKPGGIMIASLPNIRNLKVLLPLIFMDKWQYTNSGILDKTHLRFFTKSSAIELFEQGGFVVIDTPPYFSERGKAKLFNKLTLSLFSPFLQFQTIIKAVKNSSIQLTK